MKRTSLKRSFILSLTSLILCVAMLLGTTFAWFSETITSDINTIKSGNLDVELEYYKVDKTTGAGDWEVVTGKTNDIFDPNALWEPGYTEVIYLKVSNLGSLDLKYQLSVNVYDEIGSINVENKEFKLSDYIYYGIIESESFTEYEEREDALKAVTAPTLIKEGYQGATKELADGKVAYVALVVYMPTTIGNEANRRSDAKQPEIDLGINLVATQMQAEEDSFGKDYDEDAWADGFKVHSAEDLQAAINAGETNIVLMDDIVTTESIVIPASTTTYSMRAAATVINLNGNKISGSNTKTAGAVIVNNGNLVIEGDEKSVISNSTENGAAVILNNGILTINGGTYIGAPSVLSEGTAAYAVNTAGEGALTTFNGANVIGRGTVGVTKGAKAVINGGTYHTPEVAWGHAVYASGEGVEVTINGGTFSEGYEYANNNYGMYQVYSGQGAKVVINGGTFMPWDCANGYDLCTAEEGVIEVYGGTFAEDPTSQNSKNYVVDTYECNKNDDGTFTVIFPQKSFDDLLGNATAGDTVEVPAGNFTMSGNNDLVIVGSGDDTVIDITGSLKNANISNATITGDTQIAVGSDQTLTLNNVTFDGVAAKFGHLGGAASFTGCTFNGLLHFDSSSENETYKFVDCTFSGTSIIKLGGYGSYVMENCTVEELTPGTSGAWGKEWLITYCDLTMTDCEIGRVIRAGSPINITIKDSTDKNGNAVTSAIVHKNADPIVTIDGARAVYSTASLQAALDSATDGDTILLAPGIEYEKVYLARPTANNNTVMTCGTHSFTTTDAEEFAAHIAETGYHTTPDYTTTLKNLTVKGADGATVAGLIATSGHTYGAGYDHVLNKEYTSGSIYYATVNLENIVFSGVSFVGSIDINTSDADSVYDGITFDTCTFTTGSTSSGTGAAIRYYNEANNGKVKNIVINKCKFDTCYQGVYVHHVNSITVTASEFRNTGHNAIAIQNHDGAVKLEKVIIVGNTFENIADRVIRFNEVGADSDITIQNNTAINSGDDDGEVIKATSIAAGVTTTVNGNDWGEGKTVVNDELKDN